MRGYYVLEQLHTLPNVTYLAKVRNTDEVMEVKDYEEQGNHEGGEKGNEHPAGDEKKADSTLPSAINSTEGGH